MYNKILYTLLMVLLIGCSSCNNGNTASKCSKSIIGFATDTLSIDHISNKNISISVQNENVMLFNGGKENSISLSLLDIIRKCKDKNETALRALKNNNVLQIKVVVENEIDTAYNYNISPYYEEDAIFSILGQCAPLLSKFSNPTQTVDIKKWLFRKKEYLDDVNIHLLRGLVNQLSKTNTIEYVTNSTIPVIHGFSGLKYKVNSSIVADYYVLYACSSAKEIEEFVEDIISNDFDLCSKVLGGGMDCYRKSNSNGYKCICLVAINNDWRYKIQPLGLVAIDNLAPNEGENINDKSIISFGNEIRIKIPPKKPLIYGQCNVYVADWDGNGLDCNVSLHISYNGDVQKVIVSREGILAKWLSTKQFIFDLTKEKNPLQATVNMHLEDGDNFIPVTIVDNHGNEKKEKLKIRARFVRTDTHDINIDNNITIDNY